MIQKMPPKLRLKLANECDDLLSKVKLKPSNSSIKYYIIHSQHLNDVTLNKLRTLFENLMRDSYEKSSWGWNEEEKISEWKHSRTRIIILTRVEGSPDISYNKNPQEDEEVIGFMCFRFETGSDKAECALYVYELHIKSDYQRQGLGAELLMMAKNLASKFKMDKIMLTVFTSNDQALKFYKKLKFNTDKSSPASNEADYKILSYKVKN